MKEDFPKERYFDLAVEIQKTCLLCYFFKFFIQPQKEEAVNYWSVKRISLTIVLLNIFLDTLFMIYSTFMYFLDMNFISKNSRNRNPNSDR